MKNSIKILKTFRTSGTFIFLRVISFSKINKFKLPTVRIFISSHNSSYMKSSKTRFLFP